MRSATELLAEMLAIYEDPDKGVAGVGLWLHHDKEEIRECVEGGVEDERHVAGWVLDDGVLRNEELDSSIALFNDAAHLLLNAQSENASLRAAIDRARGEGEADVSSED